MKTKYLKALIGIFVISVLVLGSVRLTSMYRSSVADYRRMINEAFSQAVNAELNMRLHSLNERTTGLSIPDSVSFIPSENVVISFHVHKGGLAHWPEVQQYMLKDILPLNPKHVDSLFVEAMTKNSLRVEDSFVEYIDIKRNRVIDDNAPRVKPTGYYESSMDALDVSKTIGVKVHVKISYGTIFKPEMSWIVALSGLGAFVLVMLILSLRDRIRQRRKHQHAIDFMYGYIREIGDFSSETTQQVNDFVISLVKGQLENKDNAINRPQFHWDRISLFGQETIDNIIGKLDTPVSLVKKRLSLFLVFWELKAKAELRNDNVKSVTVNIPKDDYILITDEMHLWNILDITVDNSVVHSNDVVEIDIMVMQDDHETEIIIHDNGNGIPEQTVEYARSAPFNPARAWYSGKTDLRLRYVMRTVHELGGTIDYFSYRGENSFTQVSIKLPTQGKPD